MTDVNDTNVLRRLALSRAVKAMASELGFDRVGICTAAPVERAAYVRDWIAAGRHGEMAYLAKHLGARLNPGELLAGARSVIVTAMNYHQPAPSGPRPGDDLRGDHSQGKIARYAWGRDYHRVIKRRLHALADRMQSEIAETFETRCCVDTAPLLERELAARAGVGWIGKNTLVLDAGLGSYFFLGAIVTTLGLPADAPAVDHCGTCTRCLDACPTDAFPAAYQMDARRCISYLTIEHRGEIDPALAPHMGDWLYGCDICQEVCPHNRDAPHATEPDFAARPPAPSIAATDVLAWTDGDYARILRGSAIKRAKLDMLKRNAQIVQQNVTTRGGETPATADER